MVQGARMLVRKLSQLRMEPRSKKSKALLALAVSEGQLLRKDSDL